MHHPLLYESTVAETEREVRDPGPHRRGGGGAEGGSRDETVKVKGVAVTCSGMESVDPGLRGEKWI